jgi:hypothetical protein
MFSLCIPTINRYDNFLSKYLPLYINNTLIDEIVISDENGNDAKKIIEHFNHPKIKLNVNKEVLGPFLNKITCCQLAKNEWIALIDSDNFADDKYFTICNSYISENNFQKKAIVLAPEFAKPNFDYRHLTGRILSKSTLKSINDYEALINKVNASEVLMNTGNYVINKFLIDNLNLEMEKQHIQFSSACDVIYFNTLLFEQLDAEIHVVANLQYDHVVHDGSVYLQTRGNTGNFINYVHQRYRNLKKSN